MSDSETVIDSFSRNLPLLGRSGKNKYKSVGSSGTTTATTIPPKVLLCGSFTPLQEKADEALSLARIRNNLRAGNKAHTDPGQSFPLHSEADVVEASAIFIMSEIYEILKIMYPNRWERRSECTSGQSTKGKTQQYEDPESEDEMTQPPRKKNRSASKNTNKGTNNLRFDLIFRDKGGKTIALLEYKKTDMIKYVDFRDGLLPDSASDENIEKAVEMTKREPQLISNADSYTRQITAYSRRENCRHVALFNWDHLLLFNIDQHETGTSSEAHLICVNETGESGGFIQKCPIRKALLGWILIAFEEFYAK